MACFAQPVKQLILLDIQHPTVQTYIGKEHGAGC